MTLRTFSLSGVPIEDRGFTLTNARGWQSLPQRNFQRAALLFRDGEKVLGATAMTSPRIIGLSTLARRLTLTQRDTLLTTALREWAGLLEVISADAPDKMCHGILETADAIVHAPAFLASSSQHAVKPDLVIRCDDPLKYDLAPSSVSINAVNTPVALPVGLASARMRKLVIYLYGAFTTPITLILKNAGGDELARMTISTAATSSEYVVVDCDAFTITKYSGGVATDVTGTLDITHTFFEIAHQDTPTLQTDKGTATAHLVRAHLL